MTTAELVPCSECGRLLPESRLIYLSLEDTQGYHSPGWYCPDCAKTVRYNAFQVEDEDVYDIEDK